MPIINRISQFHDDMTAWRRSLHAQPETAFEERLTADFVADKLGGTAYSDLSDLIPRCDAAVVAVPSVATEGSMPCWLRLATSR